MSNFNIQGALDFQALGGGAKQILLDFCYPIGSYVYFNANFDSVAKVEAHYGGKWEKVEDGTFIEAGSSITTRSAGLPNITGNFKINSEIGIANDAVHTGCFSEFGDSLGKVHTAGNSSGTYNSSQIRFNANKSNSIYGNSTTVQPKSRTAYVYYRIG